MTRYALLALVLLAGCNRKAGEQEEREAVGTVERAEQKTEAKAPPPAAAPRAEAAPPAAPGRGNAIAWDGPIQWKSWEEARALAEKGKKTIMLVIYADWCPRCHELAPVFTQPDMVEAAGRLIMVKHNSDEPAPWLAKYAALGGYVPRILFIGPDGEVDTALDSGHPRYPYFYTPGNAAALKANMRKAAKPRG